MHRRFPARHGIISTSAARAALAAFDKAAAMPHYHISGKSINLSEDELLLLLRSQSFGLVTQAQTLYNALSQGFPDITETHYVGRVRAARAEFDALSRQAPDDALRELCALLHGRLAEMLALENEAIDWIAAFVGRPAADRKKLRRYIGTKYLSRTAPLGAVWVSDPGYHALCRRSLAAFDAAWLLDQQIAARITALAESRSEVFQDLTLNLTPIPRPLGRLRVSIEAIRQEIKDAAEVASRAADDLSSRFNKDSTPS